MSTAAELERAWAFREKKGILSQLQAVRVFHGPGEGTGALSRIAIDRFGEHFWMTEWESGKEALTPAILSEMTRFLESKGAKSVVALFRPEKGKLPEEPRVLAGDPPRERFDVDEEGAKFKIQLLGARHPGLFLDHLPLRRWLRAEMRGKKVLNTFAYTGSLSVAAGLGGAAHVTTLDLSNPTVRWAEENWKLNSLPAESARFISGDYFEWLPRLKREGKKFDCVILDPPSFSRGTKGNFSTAKDLVRLHELALDVLEPRGVLATSINSANISRERYEEEIGDALRSRKRSAEVIEEISQPETFPARTPEQRYLKGWILRIS